MPSYVLVYSLCHGLETSQPLAGLVTGFVGFLRNHVVTASSSHGLVAYVGTREV